MKAVFEKIIERLEEYRDCTTIQGKKYLTGAIEIINKVAKEYATDMNAGNNDSTKINQEPKTRIECLHSMSVEELADRIFVSSAIVEIDFCQNISECDDITTHGGAIPDEMCKKCLMQWLNSPE